MSLLPRPDLRSGAFGSRSRLSFIGFWRRFGNECTLEGLITSKDVLLHLPLIWREYGTGCALRALSAVVTRRRTTFLHVACNCEAVREAAKATPPAARA